MLIIQSFNKNIQTYSSANEIDMIMNLDIENIDDNNDTN